MKNKVKMIMIFFALFILLTLLFYHLLFDHNKRLLNKVYKNISLKLDEEYKDVTDVFISLYDDKTQAIVNNGHGNNIKEALKDAINKSLRSINKNYKIKLIKLDLVNNILPITKNSLNFYVNQGYGISFEENLDISFLNEELVLGDLWDNDDIDKSLIGLNPKKQKENLEQYYAFKTIKMIYRDGKLLSNDLELNSKKDIDNIMKKATDYLTLQQKEDGSFVYGYNAIKDTNIEGYNIIRHCGALVSLAEQSSLNKDRDKLKEKIQKGIKYIEKHTVSGGDNQSLYVYQEKNDNSIKLGSNALALLAVTKYMEVYGTKDYLELAKKLANGILNMQNDNGGFIFLLTLPNLNPIESERYAYYEGEAVYALARFYAISNDKKYLDATFLALDYFISNDYDKYGDHWISYAVNEVTKYNLNQAYFDLGIKNYNLKKNSFLKLNQISATDFELLMNTLELYKRFNIEYDEELLEIIDKAFKSRIQDYLFEQEAMYLSNPIKYQNTFCVKSSSYRIRIDDVQHSLSGVYLYYKNIK